jgi:hypothetical protein
MALRADDGTLLEVKEPVVLDENGEMISEGATHKENPRFSASGNVRIFNLSGILAPLFVLLVGVCIALGTVFLGVFLVAFLCFIVFRFALSQLKSRS